jgi:hypothetical protein
MSPRAWLSQSQPAGDDPEVEQVAWNHCRKHGADLVSIESIRALSDCRL